MSQAELLKDNKLQEADRSVHDWYRFVLSFPPHLVRHYLERFDIGDGETVLDPFCGTGTTLVECKKLGIPSVGIEGNPMAAFASRVKVDWSPVPEDLVAESEQIAAEASAELERLGTSDEIFFHLPDLDKLKKLEPEREKLLLSGSVSPLPLHKVLVLQDYIQRFSTAHHRDHYRLALGTASVLHASNLHFGPEVGVGKRREDAAVVAPWHQLVQGISQDLDTMQEKRWVKATVIAGDSRASADGLLPGSIGFVFTSPPYPNEKDYTRTTRLESVLLGFVNSREELRALKKGLVRSNTRGVYKDDDDDRAIEGNQTVEEIAQRIENRRIELGKTSGFERMYHRVARLYFGGMARHLAELRRVLAPGALACYVVGDQASYLGVMIRTGQLLAEIAESLGYEVVDIDLFRTRLATATREHLREEVVILRWTGQGI